MAVQPEGDVQVCSGAWIKTARGWKLRPLDYTTYTPTCERLTARPHLSNTSKNVSFARNILVTGNKGQRKVSVCLSEFLKYMGVEGAVTAIRRKAYLFDLFMIFMKDHLPKMSGTAHREVFKILEKMCNETLETEYCVHEMRSLLVGTLEELMNPSHTWIGSKCVRNRQIQLVENLIIKMDQHNCFERADDDDLVLLDLPKECLRHIMAILGNPKDILRLGQTCSYMHELSQDHLMWERMTQRHFSEKQMMTFVYDVEIIGEDLPWQQMYQKCYRKFGVKKTYTDGLVICSACKTLHWMMSEHNCWCSEDNVETIFVDPVTPEQLLPMLSL